MIGVRCARGRGARVARWIILRPTNPFDAKQVGLEGHSRYGKATIVAMAYDPRFAIAFVSSSGAGGAKLHRPIRRVGGERSPGRASITGGRQHLKYAGPLTWNDMPVDSHQLVALCAPRLVSSAAATRAKGGWTPKACS